MSSKMMASFQGVHAVFVVYFRERILFFLMTGKFSKIQEEIELPNSQDALN